MLKGRLMPWNDWLFWRGGGIRQRRAPATQGPLQSRAGSVLVVSAGPDAVEGIDMAQRHGIGLVEDDAGDAVANDLGIGERIEDDVPPGGAPFDDEDKLVDETFDHLDVH